MDAFRNLRVLSVEQALSLPYLTYRLALEGMGVLKVENPPDGDPNRSAGPRVLEEEKMNAYFLPSNCGKRAVTLNLSKPEGRRILWDLIKEWKVDIFTCNQLPNKYKELGIDYETLRSLRKDIIWLGLTGYGPDISERAYDPIIQSRAGILDLTGEREGTPFICGVSLADISGSENGYGQVMKALYKREATGEGSRIDISLFSATLTYQIINITLNKSFGTPIYRTGNNQRFFAPASVYRTSDGFIYVGVGSDSQFRILSQISGFESLQQPEFKTIRLRVENMVKLDQEINRITPKMTSQQVIELFRPYKIPIARVSTIEEVVKDSLVEGRMLKSIDPRTGLELTISPPPNLTSYLSSEHFRIPFAPRLGEHNREVYGQTFGYGEEKLKELKEKGII